MLSYQPTMFEPTRQLTAEEFSRLIISDRVVDTIKTVRQLLPTDPKAAAAKKRTLPGICWQATFDETVSAKGNRGCWRKQAAARLNGLYMLDVDHVEQPDTLFAAWTKATEEEVLRDGNHHEKGEIRRKWADGLGVLLVHVTPSGQGLRIVAIADVKRGNIADNQAWLAQTLGVEMDESCKDASRLSFCPSFDDIIYLDSNKLFNYENLEFDEKFGDLYRGGSSAATRGNNNGGGRPARVAAVEGGAVDGDAAPAQQAVAAPAAGSDGQYLNGYHGVQWNDICSAWFRANSKGKPAPGDRHQSLFKMACDFRYITDFDADLLARVITECEVGQEIARERGADELKRIAADACQLKRFVRLPKRLTAALDAAGVQLDDVGQDVGTAALPAIDYEKYASRLEGLLGDSPGLREAVAPLPRLHKLGGVLAAGAMLGTYLTRCWWEHFDGKYYRLSFLCYVVGAAASGKSFIVDLDRLLMDPMKVSDRVGREAERQYKEKQRARKANEQLPEQPHPVIRYCPSTTSNAILYRRLQDAIDPEVLDPQTGEPLHLHLITVESELATALRSQIGSWAGKADLELKSFHNETAGVDYANAESTNGIMQINWNQVVSGTQESMSRKIMPKNVLDGLVTRLALFLMPDNEYQMLERRHVIRDTERETYLRTLGYKLEQISGELHCERLVEFCHEYEARLTWQAALEADRCLDYFRKRIPVIMMRYALVRAVLRQMDALAKGADLQIVDSDLEFARLIGDWCLEAQMHMFGQMVMDALEQESAKFMPVKMHSRMREKYDSLSSTFTSADIKKISPEMKSSSIKILLFRWEKAGIIRRINNNEYEKTA